MRLGYNTNGLQNHRLDDALRLLADSGYQAVALTPDVHHLDPFRSTPHEVAAIATLLAQLGLQASIETGARFLLDRAQKHEPTLMSADPAGRARRLDFYRRAAQLGRELGAGVVSFWTGIDHRPAPDSRDRARDGVRAAVDVIRSEGLIASLEPEPGMAVATVAQWRQLQAELGVDAPALTLDIGHLYAAWEGEPVAITAACVPWLAQCHLEDMRIGEHEHLLPGAGDVDFAGVLTALRAGGYQGAVCFELSRSSHQAPAAVAACREVWRAAGLAARR